jgi:hypothetical protein
MGRGANNKPENNFLYGGVLQQEAPKEYSKTLWEHRLLAEKADFKSVLLDRCFSGHLSQPQIEYSGNTYWIVKNSKLSNELISDQQVLSINDYDSGLDVNQPTAKQIITAIEDKIEETINSDRLYPFEVTTGEYAKTITASIIINSNEDKSSQEQRTVGVIPIANLFAMEIATNYSQGQWLVDPKKKFLFYLVNSKFAGLVGMLR